MDISAVLHWSLEQFGPRQAAKYDELVRQALKEISTNPFNPRSHARHLIGKKVRTLHIARRGGKARHLFVYRVETKAIRILRLLHDSMDLDANLPEELRDD